MQRSIVGSVMCIRESLLAVVERCRHKQEQWCNGKNDEPAHLGTDRI
jgi:hypothetical protein